jgi:hypothetical protein
MMINQINNLAADFDWKFWLCKLEWILELWQLDNEMIYVFFKSWA